MRDWPNLTVRGTLRKRAPKGAGFDRHLRALSTESTSMISTERLLPCPFCGGEVNGYSFATFMPDHPSFYVAECPACDFYLTRPTRAETVAAWNRRSGVGCRRTDSELLGGNEQAEGGSAALRLSVIEECAKVADDHASTWGNAMGSPARVIADAIRTLKDNTHGA